MAMLDWNASLSVEVPAMDREHQRLIALANELNDAMKAGKGTDDLDRIFNELVSYTQNHFASEERYMRSIGYPELEAHKVEHAHLIKQVVDFKKAYDAGSALISMQLMGFLRDWVRNHIQKTDKKYGAHAKLKV